jgi:hypothetical protein
MDEQVILRSLAAGIGPDVLAALDNPSPAGDTRALGLTEALAIGSFLTSALQLAVQLWQARQDKALLTLALAEAIENGDTRLASQLDPERRLGVVGRIVARLVPTDTPAASPSIPVLKQRTKAEWLTDWTGYGEATRAMTQPVLMPFADMDNWIVYKDIHWTPPPNAPANLPRAVRVPDGFVSDLASIPSYLWWALPPTGRYGHAAILHDWLYWEQSCSRAVADRVFDVAMAELNVDPALRKSMWAAVRVAGGTYWDAAKAEKKLKKNRVLKRKPETPVTWAEWQTNPDVFA